MSWLPKRLKAITRYVPPGISLADIGTGDGQLAVYLASVLGCKVIATEFSAAGLALALRRVSAAGVQVDLRRGWGLEPLRQGEAAVIIISGMGSITITLILQSLPDGICPHYFVLQPMERTAYLRIWLHDQEWTILDEDLVREGRRFYEIIVANPWGKNSETEPESLLARGEVGPILMKKKHPLLGEFLSAKKDQYRRRVAEMSRSRAQGVERRRERAASVLKELEVLVDLYGRD